MTLTFFIVLCGSVASAFGGQDDRYWVVMCLTGVEGCLSKLVYDISTDVVLDSICLRAAVEKVFK